MATQREYEISVSAVLSRATAAGALADYVAMAHRAKAEVDKILGAPSKVSAKGAAEEGKARVTEAQKAAAELARIREKENDAILRDVAQHEKAQEKSAAKIASIKERYFREEQARGEKADAERHQRNERIISGSLSNMRKVASAASRVAGEIAGGLGADLSISSLIRKSVEAERAASNIAGYGYLEGAKGPAGVRQDEHAIRKEAISAARAGSMMGGENEALAGLEQFTKRSSDLQLGRDLFKQMAEYSLAMGANFEDVAANAGDIAKKLEGLKPEDKAKAVMGMLRTFGHEGKYGAIDYSDMAKVIPKVIGASNRFASGPEAAMAQAGVVLQVTKGLGGANIAGAATSTASFINYLASAGGLKALHAGGIKDEQIFSDKSRTKYNPLEDIMVSIMETTKGDLVKRAALLKNLRAGTAAAGFEDIYQREGAAGIHKVFKEYGGQTSEGEIQGELAKKRATTQAGVAEFNITMGEIADQLRSDLAPALKEAAPLVRDIAKAFAGVVSWAANNPGLAITAAIVGSIGKAAIGEVVGKALGGSLGAVGGILALGVVALSAEKVVFDARDEGDKRNRNADLRADEAETIARGTKKTGMVTKEDRAAFDKEIAELQARVEAAKGGGTGSLYVPMLGNIPGLGKYAEAAGNFVGGGGPDLAGIESREKDVGKLPELEKQLSALVAQKDAVQNAKISNVAEIAAAVGVAVAKAMPGASPSAPTGGTVSQ